MMSRKHHHLALYSIALQLETSIFSNHAAEQYSDLKAVLTIDIGDRDLMSM